VRFSVEGNIAYGELSTAVSTAQDIIAAMGGYAGLGLLACSVAYFGGKAISVTALALVSPAVTAASSLIAYKLAGGRSLALAMITFGGDMLASLAVHALALTVLLLMHRRAVKRGRATVAPLNGRLTGKGGIFPFITAAVSVFGGAKLLLLVVNTVSDFTDPSLGLPVNLGEWIYWLTEYAMLFIYAAIGYFISVAIAYLCEHYKGKKYTPLLTAETKAE
jgi:hypothetical protein